MRKDRRDYSGRLQNRIQHAILTKDDEQAYARMRKLVRNGIITSSRSIRADMESVFVRCRRGDTRQQQPPASRSNRIAASTGSPLDPLYQAPRDVTSALDIVDFRISC